MTRWFLPVLVGLVSACAGRTSGSSPSDSGGSLDASSKGDAAPDASTATILNAEAGTLAPDAGAVHETAIEAASNAAPAAPNDSAPIVAIDDPSQVEVLSTKVGSDGVSLLALQSGTLFYVELQGGAVGFSSSLYSVSLTAGGAPDPVLLASPGPFMMGQPSAIALGGFEASAATVTFAGGTFETPFSFYGDAGVPWPSAAVASTVDAAQAYWSTPDGTVWQVPLDGSAPAIELAAQATPPASMAVDSTSVYWTNPAAETVAACAIGGCGLAPRVVAAGQHGVNGIAADAQGVYWTNRGSGGAYDGSLYRWRLADSAPECLVSGLWAPALLVLDSTSVYWSSGDLIVRSAPR
jgi:hypothetical protein